MNNYLILALILGALTIVLAACAAQGESPQPTPQPEAQNMKKKYSKPVIFHGNHIGSGFGILFSSRHKQIK